MTMKELEKVEKKLKEKKERNTKQTLSMFLEKISWSYIVHILSLVLIICMAVLLWVNDRNARNAIRTKLIEKVALIEQLEKEDERQMRLIIHEMVKPEALKQP